MTKDVWSHQNKTWQEVLEVAREYGWHAERASNHGGLILQCPEHAPEHRIRILSTGRGTESMAQSSLKRVQRCGHRDVSVVLTTIRTRLDGAERLLDGAEALLALADAEQRIEDILANLDDASGVLSEMEQDFDAAMIDQEAAQRRAAASLGEERSSMAPADLARDAASSLREANLKLRDDLPREHSEWQRLRGRHDVLKQRLESLRSALP